MKISIKTILPMILFSAMLILLSGCFGTVPDGSPGYTPGSITGIIMVPIDCTECQTSDCITKSNGEVPSHWTPVEDAIVTVIPHATLTDENGYYTLSDIEPGVYYVITATYGNLVLKDIVEPPGVKAGETYDAGTANCESTALGLIVEALLDMGLETEDIELALEIIKENPKFDELVDIICCIIEDCDNVTLVCEIDELVQDIIDDEPGYTPLLESLTIIPDSISLCIGATKSIEPYVTFIAHYTGEDDKIVVAGCTYSSGNSGIASISGSSSVFGVSEGETTIDVSASYTEGETTVNVNGDIPVSVIDCSVECVPELESLSVVLGNTQPMTLCNGATQNINSLHIASIIAHYTCGVDEILALSDCTYTSENPSIAFVSGRSVTGNDVGSTNIVVRYNNGDKTVVATQKVAVEVVDCTTIESITVSPTPLNLCAADTGSTATETGTLTTTAHYSDGLSIIVTPDSYVIGNTNIVATFSLTTGLVTSGSTTGQTTVTVTYEGETAAATVNVTDCTGPAVDYDLIMEVSPTGSGTTIPVEGGPYTYTAGTVVTISASAKGGYHFVDWSGNVANSNSSSTTVTMDANQTVTANFELDVADYDLIMEVSPTGSGTTIPVEGGPYTYTAGQVVTISASAEPGFEFTGWTAPEGTFGDASAAVTTFTMPAQNVTVTATFDENTGCLLVKVYNPEGAGFGAGTVTLSNGSMTYGPYDTLANGWYTFTNIPVGTYTLEADRPGAPGWVRPSKTVIITIGTVCQGEPLQYTD